MKAGVLRGTPSCGVCSGADGALPLVSPSLPPRPGLRGGLAVFLQRDPLLFTPVLAVCVNGDWPSARDTLTTAGQTQTVLRSPQSP